MTLFTDLSCATPNSIILNTLPAFLILNMSIIKTLVLTASAFLLVTGITSAQTASAPQVLTNGTPVGPLAGANYTNRFFKIAVPTGATNATFAITGTSGDCDLYVKRGSAPSSSSWTYRPYLSSSNETVSVTNPPAGDWYIMLRAYSAYANVTLRASHSGGVIQPPVLVAATPTFSVAAGTYSGQINVGLATTTANAVLRFTTDGTTPTAASEVYTAPILVSTTTTIKAIAFAYNHTPSPVASGTYTIQSAIVTLVNDTPVPNLSGAVNSVANFKLSVPAGQTTLTLTITGGTGDCDLYVKYGQLATTSVWDQRPYLGNNNETVTINTPAAGDYYIMLHGFSSFAGVTLKGVYSGAVVAPGLPDLTFHAPTMNPRITTETFSSTACEIQEGTITAGTHKLLRFSTESRNIGTADLVLGNPSTNPSFAWGACHGHYHFNSFAEYRLLNAAGQLVRTGHKVGFCLMDISRHSSSANPSARYNCSNQGIQAGWADIYSSSLSGQWIVITDLAPGNYILEVVVDPMNVIAEANENNNVTQVPVVIP